MQISGKCKIANQWKDNQIDKNAFDFENKGKVGKGRLTWSDVIKGKNGEKDAFISTTKKFICFGANIDFIEQNIGQQFEIVGSLKTVKLPFPQFKNEQGKAISYDEIVINEIKLAEAKAQSEHHQAKSNGYQPQQEDNMIDDSEIPF